MKTTTARRRRRQIDNPEYFRMLDRMIEKAGDRAAAGDVEELAQLQELARSLDQALVTAILGLRSSGHTWESIGAATGTTRQAALMRWSPKLGVQS